ncbi:DUF397 domain-containing protein [Streptomyces sp. NPDC054933]
MNTPADLYAIDFADVVWRKSSYTANNGNCVGVAQMSVPAVAVRDSKRTDIPAARVSAAAWASFVTAVATGSLTA